MKQVDSSFFEGKIDMLGFEKTLVEMSIQNPIQTVFYIDNVEDPEVYFLIRRGVGGVLFSLGDEKQTPTNLDSIEDLLKEHKAAVLMLDSVEYRDVMSHHYGFKCEERCSFVYEAVPPKDMPSLTHDFQIIKIELPFAKQIENEIDPDFRLLWRSPEAFIESGGSGFCLIREGKILSCVWSAFTTDKSVEIAITTREEWREKGFARLLCAHFIEQVISEDRAPRWNCHKKNTPSMVLAKSLGFKISQEYSWLYAPKRKEAAKN